jgi:hypothetical protein
MRKLILPSLGIATSLRLAGAKVFSSIVKLSYEVLPPSRSGEMN